MGVARVGDELDGVLRKGDLMRLSEKARVWTVRYTRPKEVGLKDGQSNIWQYNYCATVIAISVGAAINETFLEYPDATIVSVNPGPGGEVIVGGDIVIGQ